MKLLPIRAMSVAIALSLSSPLVSLLGLLPEKNAIAEEIAQPATVAQQSTTAEVDVLRSVEAFNLLLTATGLFYQNQSQEALEVLNQALALFQQADDRFGEGTILSEIGAVHSYLGQNPTALEYYQQALAAHREAGDRAGEGNTLTRIGAVYIRLGQYPAALEYSQQALAIHRELSNRVGEGTSLNNIGGVYHGLGQYPAALEVYQQALAIHRETDDPFGEGFALYNIGGIYYGLGQYSAALESFQQALTIRREIRDRAGEAATLNAIGGVYYSLEQYTVAVDYLQQALAIHREIRDRAGEGATLNNIGEIYGSFGQYPAALEAYQQALAIFREVGDRVGEGFALHGIGGIYYELGQYSTALESYQQALAIRHETGDRAGESKTLSNIGGTLYATHQYAAAEEALFQALTVLESLRDTELSDADKVALFETQQFTYQGLQQALIAQNDSEKMLTALAVSERGRARALVELLATRQADFSLASAPDIAMIQRIAQQQNATLVQYSVIDNKLGLTLYVWVVQPDGEITFRSLDLTTLEQPLSELVSTSRAALGVRGRSPDGTVTATLTPDALAEQQAQQRQILQELYQLLIEPIAAELPTDPNEHVIFIPHQDLFLVPFPALVNAEGEYLIENHTIRTAPSIQVLGLTHELDQQADNNTPLEALIVGNPIMPEVWNPESDSKEQLSSLTGAEDEAVAIAELFDNTQPLLWDQASEATVKQQMTQAQIIHLATHGLLEYGDPQESGVRDFPGAIALAPSHTDDGLLTSTEIQQMDLKADLVVLSACDTGRGRISGDGVIGLSRSLITAGVPSVIVSLWQVPDQPTAFLMKEFYQNLQQAPDKAQALRQAMLATMETHPEPIDWAAFTLIGEAE